MPAKDKEKTKLKVKTVEVTEGGEEVSSPQEEKTEPFELQEEPPKPAPEMPGPEQKRHPGAFVTGFLAATIIYAFLSTLAIGYFRYKVKPGLPSPTPTPTAEVTPAPFDRSAISFEVLNGSGIKGLAAKIADKLTALGYKTVKVGNTDKSYKVSELFIAPTASDSSDLILADMTKEFAISTVSGVLKNSTASARLILGKDLQ